MILRASDITEIVALILLGTAIIGFSCGVAVGFYLHGFERRVDANRECLR